MTKSKEFSEKGHQNSIRVKIILAMVHTLQHLSMNDMFVPVEGH